MRDDVQSQKEMIRRTSLSRVHKKSSMVLIPTIRLSDAATLPFCIVDHIFVSILTLIVYAISHQELAKA